MHRISIWSARNHQADKMGGHRVDRGIYIINMCSSFYYSVRDNCFNYAC
jgi:hypothetical protein